MQQDLLSDNEDIRSIVCTVNPTDTKQDRNGAEPVDSSDEFNSRFDNYEGIGIVPNNTEVWNAKENHEQENVSSNFNIDFNLETDQEDEIEAINFEDLNEPKEAIFQRESVDFGLNKAIIQEETTNLDVQEIGPNSSIENDDDHCVVPSYTFDSKGTTTQKDDADKSDLDCCSASFQDDIEISKINPDGKKSSDISIENIEDESVVPTYTIDPKEALVLVENAETSNLTISFLPANTIHQNYANIQEDKSDSSLECQEDIFIKIQEVIRAIPIVPEEALDADSNCNKDIISTEEIGTVSNTNDSNDDVAGILQADNMDLSKIKCNTNDEIEISVEDDNSMFEFVQDNENYHKVDLFVISIFLFPSVSQWPILVTTTLPKRLDFQKISDKIF